MAGIDKQNDTASKNHGRYDRRSGRRTTFIPARFALRCGSEGRGLRNKARVGWARDNDAPATRRAVRSPADLIQPAAARPQRSSWDHVPSSRVNDAETSLRKAMR